VIGEWVSTINTDSGEDEPSTDTTNIPDTDTTNIPDTDTRKWKHWKWKHWKW